MHLATKNLNLKKVMKEEIKKEKEDGRERGRSLLLHL
jgi:hypothetical protein